MSDQPTSKDEGAGGTAVFICGPAEVMGRFRECIGCGGSTSADPMPGEERGPFTAPEGSRTAGWDYCSESCWEDWEEHLEREAEARTRLTALCPVCGFDRQEHDPDVNHATLEADR